jgi:hypothetical protein
MICAPSLHRVAQDEAMTVSSRTCSVARIFRYSQRPPPIVRYRIAPPAPRHPRRSCGTPPHQNQLHPLTQTRCWTPAAAPRRTCHCMGNPVEMPRSRKGCRKSHLPTPELVTTKTARWFQWASQHLPQKFLLSCSARPIYLTASPAAGPSLRALAEELRAAALDARRSRARSAGHPLRSRRSPPGDARTA